MISKDLARKTIKKPGEQIKSLINFNLIKNPGKGGKPPRFKKVIQTQTDLPPPIWVNDSPKVASKFSLKKTNKGPLIKL